jgi:hypothetical protein
MIVGAFVLSEREYIFANCVMHRIPEDQTPQARMWSLWKLPVRIAGFIQQYHRFQAAKKNSAQDPQIDSE